MMMIKMIKMMDKLIKNTFLGFRSSKYFHFVLVQQRNNIVKYTTYR